MSREVMQQALEALETVLTARCGGDDGMDISPINAAYGKAGSVITVLKAALAEPCKCGDRTAAECPGEWEPGCDLGANEAHAVVAKPVQEPVKLNGGRLTRYPDGSIGVGTPSPQRQEPDEPVAVVELMKTGGNAGLATRIVEIDDHLRERLWNQALPAPRPAAPPAHPKEKLMSNKFTAIYTESSMVGSHRHTLTKMRRVEKFDGETITDMLKRESIEDYTVYLFHGHPMMPGEKPQEPVQEPVAFPEGYEPHELPADYEGPLWIEGQVRRLYELAKPKRQPLSGLEVERLLEQVIGSLPVARNLIRAVEAAHGIGEQK